MGKGAIPDRWINYKPIGRQIDGTRFIAFKVPLKSYISDTVEDIEKRLDIEKILHAIPKLGLVIDLTNTYRYYNAEHFSQYGIEYNKLKVPGHVIPPQNLRSEFREIVRSFLKRNRHNDKLIGVHCTHGVNRTGFFICDHMVTDLSMVPRDAIKRFESARGHPIERKNYLNALQCRREGSACRDIGHVKGPENLRERSSANPSRRPSPYQNGAIPAVPPPSSQSQRAYGRDSIRYESSQFSTRQSSGNDERPHNGSNPFRREILWSTTSSIPRSGQSLNDFRNESRRNSFSRESERSSFPSQRNNSDQSRSNYTRGGIYDRQHTTQKDNNSSDRYRQVPRPVRDSAPNGRIINQRFERDADQDFGRRQKVYSSINSNWRNDSRSTNKFRSSEGNNKTWRNHDYNRIPTHSPRP